ncbi:MAG: Glucokinase [Segetibacter sp.]|nr:Glucokinase [Segetibacter sp.]
MHNNIVVGVDIGGSHITAALIDLDAHSIIHHSIIRRSVNSKGTADQVIKDWAGAIANCKAFHPKASCKIGIAMPGPFDYEKGISYIKGLDKYEVLFNLNVKELLAQELHIQPTDIYMMNDASCFLKGEVFGGAAKGKDNVIGLTLGTGLGSAVWKHNMIIEGDLYCTPYKESTAEDYLSTRWFIKRYKELTGKTAANVKEIRDVIPSDEAATFLFTEFGRNLGIVLSSYIKRHQVDVVVIGGNIINASGLFIPVVESVLHEQSLKVSILNSCLNEDSALLGAGSLWRESKRSVNSR